jgi:hypothetical protein
MIFSDNPTTPVNENPAFDTQRLDFMFQDTGIDKNTTADAEFRVLIDKTGRYHADTIFLGPDLDSVSGIRTHTAAGDDYGFVLKSNMGNNLALPLIPKKSTNDDCTTHSLSCSIGQVPK